MIRVRIIHPKNTDSVLEVALPGAPRKGDEIVVGGVIALIDYVRWDADNNRVTVYVDRPVKFNA